MQDELQFPAAVAELKNTYAILVADLDAVVAYGKHNSSEFAHRTLVRTHFALVEGLTFQLMLVALAAEKDAPGLFTAAEVGLLRQERYELADTGKPKRRPTITHALPYLRFAIDCFSRAYRMQFHPEYGTQGWKAMTGLTRVRNRLTHPKNAEDLRLSEDDLQLVVTAARWFKETMISLMNECAKDESGGA